MHLWKSQAIKNSKMQKNISIVIYKLPEMTYWVLMTAEEGESLSIAGKTIDILSII